MRYNHGMNHTADLIWISIIISAAALGLGWFISLNHTQTPTFGDMLEWTAKSYGVPAFCLIVFLWWAIG